MKSGILASTFMFMASLMMAQQDPVHSLNYFNSQLYNPAITGSTKNNQVFILNRSQWKEFDGPQVKAATFDFRVPKRHFSTGFIFSDQKSGAFSVTRIKLNYTHHVLIKDGVRLLLGLSGGVAMNKFNVGEINAIRMDDPSLLTSDRSTKADLDAGVMLRSERFRAGLGITQLEGDMFSSTEAVVVPNRQIVLSTDYIFKPAEESDFSFTPLLIAKIAPGNPFFLDGTISASWKELVWLSAGYKSSYAAQMSLGIEIKNIRAAYSYELPVNSLKGFIPPAHEFGIGYVFKSYTQSKQKKTVTVKKPKSQQAEKGKKQSEANDDKLAAKKKELAILQSELSDREDNLISHERKIFELIDSLYTKASQQKTKTNEEELERVARTQREVNKIKQELKDFTREKNVELFKLKQRIDALKREIDVLEN